MNKEEQEKQERILSKLSWLNERAQPDFKGNPPPFEEPKTMQSVQKARRAQARKLAGEGDFMPFWHTPTPLAMEATRSGYLANANHAKFDAALSRKSNCSGQQRIDPETGLTEIQSALCWDAPIVRNAPGQTPCRDVVCSQDSCRSCMSDQRRSAGPRQRLDMQQVNTLPPKERTAAYRAENLAHPMFTRESAEAHGDRWRHGTQLAAPVVSAPRKRNGGRGLDRRNHVRLVVYERANW